MTHPGVKTEEATLKGLFSLELKLTRASQSVQPSCWLILVTVTTNLAVNQSLLGTL